MEKREEFEGWRMVGAARMEGVNQCVLPIPLNIRVRVGKTMFSVLGLHVGGVTVLLKELIESKVTIKT